MGKQKLSSEEVVDQAIAALEDVKGADILTMDVREKTSITHYTLVFTGHSYPQLNALAERVREQSTAAAVQPLGEESNGDSAGELPYPVGKGLPD